MAEKRAISVVQIAHNQSLNFVYICDAKNGEFVGFLKNF